MTDHKSALPPVFSREVVYQKPYTDNCREGISYGEDARQFDLTGLQ